MKDNENTKNNEISKYMYKMYICSDMLYLNKYISGSSWSFVALVEKCELLSYPSLWNC